MRPKPGHLCYDCARLNKDKICSVYGLVGMNYRHRQGMCPVVDRYADWREDKPRTATTKIRIGQQKNKK